MAWLIVKLTFIISLAATLSACSWFAPKPSFETINFDYQVPAPYGLTEEYRSLSVIINDNQPLPEKKLDFERLKLRWEKNIEKAQIQVYLNYSKPFLVERRDAVRKEVVYDEKDRGEVRYIPIQRAFIRTHYNIEIVDAVKDSLIRHIKFAHNYPIEVEKFKDKKKSSDALKAAYLENKPEAEKDLKKDLWEKLKLSYLQDVTVTFAHDEFKIVKEYEPEPQLEKAYEWLVKNNKIGAQKALNIYNQLNKKYSDKLKDDNSKFNEEMLGYISKGITASTSIINHDYAERYQLK